MLWADEHMATENQAATSVEPVGPLATSFQGCSGYATVKLRFGRCRKGVKGISRCASRSRVDVEAGRG